MGLASTMKMSPTDPKTAMLYFAAIQTARWARSGFFAPSDWPTMVGQSLGAKNPDRAQRAVWIAAKYNMAVLGSVGLIFIVLASPIVGVFTHYPEAASIGAQ